METILLTRTILRRIHHLQQVGATIWIITILTSPCCSDKTRAPSQVNGHDTERARRNAYGANVVIKPTLFTLYRIHLVPLETKKVAHRASRKLVDLGPLNI